MREFISDLHSDSKLFVADYDSYSIKKYNITSEKLLYVTKIGMLLFDHLLLPAAFFWQSEEMAQIMLRLEEAISYGAVLPVIRNSEDTADIIDYFEHRVEESQKISYFPVFSQPELATEIAGAKNAREVRQLQDINSFVHLGGTSIREKYALNWLDDFDNNGNINSIRLLLAQSSMPLDSIRDVLDSLKGIARNPQFSRAYCINHIQSLVSPGKVRDLLEERTSWLYLKSNADVYQSGLFYSRDPYNGMLFADNLVLLAQTLSIFGLTKDVIAALSVNDILNLKKTIEYQNFISGFNCMVEKAYTQQEKIVEKLQQKIVSELRSEEIWRKIYKSLSWIQRFSRTIFLEILINHFSGSEINTPIFVATAAGATVPVILKRFDAINQHMVRQSFLDFRDYIISKQYRNKIMDNLEHLK